MTNKTIKMIVGAMCVVNGVFCACDAGAKDLFWEGTNGTWSVGGGGWKLADGTPAVFEEGDNVTFGDAQETKVVVTLKDHFEVGNIIIDAATDYEIIAADRRLDAKFVDGYIADAKYFEKRGTGALQLNGFAGTFTNNMWFKEGTVSIRTQTSNYFDIENHPFGSLSAGSRDREIRFGSGDSENLLTADIPYSYNGGVHSCWIWKTIAPTFIFDGASASWQAQNVFRDIVLMNGSKLAPSSAILTGDVYVRRRPDNKPSPRIETQRGNWTLGMCVGLTPTNSTTFYVDDVTSADGEGDDDVDFYFAAGIGDARGTMPAHRNEYKPLVGFSANSSWAKRGNGTMEIACIDSYYTGNIDVYEGVLYTKTARNLGEPRAGTSAGRVITIHPGARMTVNASPTFWLREHFGYQNPADLTFIVTNSIFQMKGCELGCNNWQFYGSARLEFLSENESGLFNFASNTIFRCNHPIVIPNVNTSYHPVRLDVMNDCNEEATVISINDVSYTITKRTGYSRILVDECGSPTNGIADLVIEAPIADSWRGETMCASHAGLKLIYGGNQRTNSLEVCSLVKDGTGVLQISSRNNSYMGITDIREGGLLLTGALRTNIVIRSGSIIGGSGTIGFMQDRKNRTFDHNLVADLNIEEGGGFLVDALNLTDALTVNGKTKLPQSGIVKLYNVGTKDVSQIKFENIPLPNCTAIEGTNKFDAASWKVEVDGMTPRETRSLMVTFNNLGTENPSYSIIPGHVGFKVIVR